MLKTLLKLLLLPCLIFCSGCKDTAATEAKNNEIKQLTTKEIVHFAVVAKFLSESPTETSLIKSDTKTEDQVNYFTEIYYNLRLENTPRKAEYMSYFDNTDTLRTYKVVYDHD